MHCCLLFYLQEVAEVLADTEAALTMVRRELQASPPRVICSMSVSAPGPAATDSTAGCSSADAAAGCVAVASVSTDAAHVTVHLLPDRYSEIMSTVVLVSFFGKLDLCAAKLKWPPPLVCGQVLSCWSAGVCN